MLLVKLMTLRPTHRQIKKMLAHVDSPYIRIVAAFFIRYTQVSDLYVVVLFWFGLLLLLLLLLLFFGWSRCVVT